MDESRTSRSRAVRGGRRSANKEVRLLRLRDGHIRGRWFCGDFVLRVLKTHTGIMRPHPISRHSTGTNNHAGNLGGAPTEETEERDIDAPRICGNNMGNRRTVLAGRSERAAGCKIYSFPSERGSVAQAHEKGDVGGRPRGWHRVEANGRSTSMKDCPFRLCTHKPLVLQSSDSN